jgi:hypothetical protein
MTGRTPTRAARASAILWVALASITSPRVAAAQSSADVEAARACFVEAAKLGNEGRWKEARDLYARSFQLKPAPITRYSLGVAQRETGRLSDALSSFRAFLAEPPAAATAPYEAPARAAVAELEKGIGQVSVRIEPRLIDGLTLTIDGQPVPPALDLPREIDPGAHEVVAHAPGFLRATARFSVAAGASASVALTLTHAATFAGAHPIAGGSVSMGEPLAPLAPPVEPVFSPTLPVVLMGIGGALFGVGLTVGVVGVVRASHAPTRDGADASAARTMGIAGDVIGTLGIATAGAGLVLLLVQGRHSPDTTAANRIAANVSGLGLRF